MSEEEKILKDIEAANGRKRIAEMKMQREVAIKEANAAEKEAAMSLARRIDAFFGL